ncbi:hypothetical protein NE237_001473 [Protea cynaroides]|uniref:Agenet domain-containing protein n=1 Tax=Protea cynaroides TaxID=273540 RepID=A0A9Q0KTE6_9MAGN|nr:hypothetical protein NE237_001473 [Protea cynaroides]
MENSSKDQRKNRYRIGDSVEVHSKEEGFVGSYYEAKVLEVAKNHVFVIYKTLLSDDESEWLRERVHVSEVRPRPPQLWTSGFHQWDEVDAFDNEGWWVGRICNITESKYYACFNGNINGKDSSSDDDCQKRRRLVDESKYYVYFPNSSGDVIPYSSSQLRLHQEWKNGKWVPSTSCF